jgi:hypothetical protein
MGFTCRFGQVLVFFENNEGLSYLFLGIGQIIGLDSAFPGSQVAIQCAYELSLPASVLARLQSLTR